MTRVDALQLMGELGPGEHLCCVYGSEEEHRLLVVPYLRKGLERGEKVVYIAEEHTPQQITSMLEEAGVEVGAALESGQLSFYGADETYLKGGSFDPHSMLRLLEEEADRALSQGYPCLRGTGEMSWALRGLPGSDRLMEYEALLNRLVRERPVIAFCQYDRRRFPQRELLQVLVTHPRVLVGPYAYDNFLYLDPASFGKEAGGTNLVQLWLDELEERELLERGVREAERERQLVFDAMRDPAMVLGPDFRILRANRAACRLLGAEEEELIGRRCYELVHLAQGPAAGCPMARMLESGGAEKGEMFLQCDGSWAEVSVEPLPREEETPGPAVHLMHDVTERRRMEQELRRSQDLLEMTQDISRVGGWRWDVARQEMFWTEELYRLHGFEPGELEAGSPEHIRRSLACYHPEDRELVEEAFRRCCEEAVPYDLTVRFTRADGKGMWVRTAAQPVVEEGRVVEVIGNFMDVNPVVEAEEALRREHEQFLSVMDAVEAPIYVSDPDTYEVLFVNRALKERLGGDVVGGLCYREFQGLDGPCGFCTNRKIKELDGEPYYWEFHNRLLDRDYYVIDRLIDWPDGRRVRFEMALDVTERRRAEEELHRREMELRRITEAMLDMVGQGDVNGVFQYISPSCEKVLGYRPEELLGRPVFELVHPEDLPGVVEAFAKARDTLEPNRVEYRYRHARGHYVWLETIGNPLYDEAGELIGAVFTTRDVTERRRYQEELARSEEEYRRLMEAASDAIIVADADSGIIIGANRRAEELTGHAVSELVGMHQSSLHPPEEEEKYRRLFEEHGRGEGMVRQAEVQHRDGRRVPVEISASLVEAGGRRLLQGIFRDLGGRYRYLARLDRLSRGLLALGADPRENIKALLELARSVLGARAAEYHRLERGTKMVSGEEGAVREEGLSAPDLAREWIREAGSRQHAFSGESAAPAGESAAPCFLCAPVGAGKGAATGAICVFDRGGRQFEKEDEELLEIIAHALESQEERLRYEENLRDFIDVASHELRHPVTVMKGYAAMLRDRAEAIDEASRAVILDVIEHGADRLNRLVEGLLDVSRIERGAFAVVPESQPLVPLAERAVREMAERGFDNPFEIRVSPGLISGKVDGERFTQLLVILLENAVKFSSAHQPVEIEMEEREGDVLVSVLDRGPGVSPECRERVFDRFFQEEDVLHHSKPGLGMGLYIARQIVGEHGGCIWYEPRQGGGAAFRFTVPR